MGFRRPITSAAAVDTGQPAGAGVRVYQRSTATGTAGVVEFRDGIAGDDPATITAQANLAPQGGGFTAQGGSLSIGGGSYNGVPQPSLDLAVIEAAAGGYQPATRLRRTSELRLPDDAGWSSYVPTWTAANGATVLGNGTLTGRVRSLGCSVDFAVVLVLGSTTNPAAGVFGFALPAAAVTGRQQWVPVKAFTSDGRLWAGAGYIAPGAAVVVPWLPHSATDTSLGQAQNANSAGTAGTGVPTVAGSYPFMNGCDLVISGTYETAAPLLV